MYIYIHRMLAKNISSISKNMKHLEWQSTISITEHVNNEPSFDVTNVSVKSMEIMECQMQGCAEEVRSR